MYAEFQRIQSYKSNTDDLEKTIDDLNLKNLELKDQMNSYKDKYEESMNPFEAFKGRVSVSFIERGVMWKRRMGHRADG